MNFRTVLTAATTDEGIIKILRDNEWHIHVVIARYLWIIRVKMTRPSWLPRVLSLANQWWLPKPSHKLLRIPLIIQSLYILILAFSALNLLFLSLYLFNFCLFTILRIIKIVPCRIEWLNHRFFIAIWTGILKLKNLVQYMTDLSLITVILFLRSLTATLWFLIHYQIVRENYLVIISYINVLRRFKTLIFGTSTCCRFVKLLHFRIRLFLRATWIVIVNKSYLFILELYYYWFINNNIRIIFSFSLRTLISNCVMILCWLFFVTHFLCRFLGICECSWIMLCKIILHLFFVAYKSLVVTLAFIIYMIIFLMVWALNKRFSQVCRQLYLVSVCLTFIKSNSLKCFISRINFNLWFFYSFLPCSC